MNTTASQPTSTKASSTKSGTTVLLTAVAYFMVTLDTLVVVTALPSIHRSFGGGIATLQWTVERVHDRVRRGHLDRGRAR